MSEPMALPPGLEFMRTPFMSPVGSPAVKPDADPTAVPAAELSLTEGPQRYSVAPGTTKVARKACTGLTEQVRQAVAVDIDVKVAERLENIMAKGEQGMKKFLVESRSQHEELSKQIAEFKEREAVLQLENAALQQIFATVLGQLAQWGGGGQFNLGEIWHCADAGAVDAAALGNQKAPAADACADGASTTTASERGGGDSAVSDTVSPYLTFDASPLPFGAPPAPPGLARSSSESSGSGSEDPLEAPPGLSRPLPKFPDAPPFPFSSPPQVPSLLRPSTPLSLSDALGHEAAHQTAPPPLTGPSLSPAAPAFSPFSIEYASEVFPSFGFDFGAEADTDLLQPADGFIFNIMLRKADGCSFGLATSATSQENGVLHIDGVLSGGAAEAWNRQCASSGAAEKVLLPGDHIVSVNGITGNPEDMKLECESQQLLRLMVVRSDGPRSAPPPHVAAVSVRSTPGTTMRAEAVAFVPFSAEAPEFVPMGMIASDEYHVGY